MFIDTAGSQSNMTSESGGDQSVNYGMIHFSLRHDAEASALVVTVVKATGLQEGDAESFNPYVKVRLLPDKHQKAKTKVVRRSANPVFDEAITFAGVDAGRLQKRGSAVHMSVFNSDAFSKHAFVGELTFYLGEVDLQSQSDVIMARPLSKVRRSSRRNVRIN